MSLIKHDHPATWPPETGWGDARVDRIFRDMFRDFFAGSSLRDRITDGQPVPLRVEEYVEDGFGVIRAELPGVDPDKDVEITVSDGLLRIRAHRTERAEDTRPDGYRSEFHYGAFQRVIALPAGANASDVTADYRDGVLEVRVPMPPAEEPAAVKVTVEHA